MPLIDILKKAREKMEGGNKGLAIALHEQWPPSLFPVPEINTLESRLSELMNGKSKGAKFFFEDRSVSALLFRVLEILEDQWEALRDEGESLASGTPLVQVVVDVSSMGLAPDAQESLFKQVHNLLSNTGVKAAIVHTEAQHDALPRSFDTPEFVQKRVANANEGAAEAQAFVAKRGLLLSPLKGAPPERWAALSWDGTALRIYPEDALQTYLKVGVLPSPPQPAHDLTALGYTPNGEPLPRDPLMLRKLYDTLGNANEAKHLGAPEQRLSWAQSLGIPAASSAQERTESEIQKHAARLQMTPELGNPQELSEILRSATTRPMSPRLLRVDNALHAVNVPDAISKGCLVAHQISSREPMNLRLLHAIQGWTRDQYLEDPFLERALSVPEEERLPLDIARAGWLSAGVPEAEPTLSADWREGMDVLLADNPPPASLLIEHGKREQLVPSANAPSGFLTLQQQTKHQRASGLSLPTAIPLTLADRKGGALVSRSDTMNPADPMPTQLADARQRGYSFPTPTNGWRDPRDYHGWRDPRDYPLVPVGRDILEDAERWLDIVELEMEAREVIRAHEKGDINDAIQAHEKKVDKINRRMTEIARLMPRTQIYGQALTQSDQDKAQSLQSELDSLTREKTNLLRQYPLRRTTLPDADVTKLVHPAAWQERDSPVALDSLPWSDADRDLALAWLALKRALQNGEAVVTHDGVALLIMDAGMIAELRVRHHGATDAPLVAALKANPRYGIAISRKSHIGLDHPEGLYLKGKGWAADVRFLSSPFYLAQGTSDSSAVRIAAENARLEEERCRREDDAERRRREDDDDD